MVSNGGYRDQESPRSQDDKNTTPRIVKAYIEIGKKIALISFFA